MDTNPLVEVQQRTFLRRKFLFRLALIFSIISMAVLTAFSKINDYFGFDLVISKFIQSIRFWGFEELMMVLTLIGDAPISIIIIAGSFVLLLAIRKRLDAFTLLFSSFGSILISQIIKNLVARPRPDSTLVLKLVSESSGSFPSGHVLFFISFFGVLLFLSYSKLKMTFLRNLLVLGFGLMILSIGASRIYVGAHWFSDVLGSYLIGTIWLYIIVTMYKKYSF